MNFKTNYMKKYLLIFALLLGAVCSWGQKAGDPAMVLQKSLGQQSKVTQLQKGDPVSSNLFQSSKLWKRLLCNLETNPIRR